MCLCWKTSMHKEKKSIVNFVFYWEDAKGERTFDSGLSNSFYKSLEDAKAAALDFLESDDDYFLFSVIDKHGE